MARGGGGKKSVNNKKLKFKKSMICTEFIFQENTGRYRVHTSFPRIYMIERCCAVRINYGSKRRREIFPVKSMSKLRKRKKKRRDFNFTNILPHASGRTNILGKTVSLSRVSHCWAVGVNNEIKKTM